MQSTISKAVNNLSRLGISQRKIADTLGISRSSVYNYIKNPDTQTTKQLTKKADSIAVKTAIAKRKPQTAEKFVEKNRVKRSTFKDRFETKAYLKGSKKPAHPTILEKSRNLLKRFWSRNFTKYRVMYFSADIKFTLEYFQYDEDDKERSKKVTRWELKSKTHETDLYDSAFDSLINTFLKFFDNQKNTNDESIDLNNAFPKSIAYMSLDNDIANFETDIIDSKLEITQISLYFINILDIE